MITTTDLILAIIIIIFVIGLFSAILCIIRACLELGDIRKYDREGAEPKDKKRLICKRIEDLGLIDNGDEKERGIPPQLQDLSMMSKQYEMARLSSTLLRFSSSILLICGIFGTLCGAHNCFDVNKEIDITKLSPALVPSMFAVGSTVLLVLIGSIYHWRLDKCLSALDKLTLTKLIPQMQANVKQGFSDSMSKFTDNIQQFSQDMGGIADAASSMKSCIQALNESSGEFSKSCDNINQAFTSIQDINQSVQESQSTLKVGLEKSISILENLDSKFVDISMNQTRANASMGEISQSFKQIQTSLSSEREAQQKLNDNLEKISANMQDATESIKSLDTVITPLQESVHSLNQSSAEFEQYSTKVDAVQSSLNKAYASIAQVEQQEQELQTIIEPITQAHDKLANGAQYLYDQLNATRAIATQFNQSTEQSLQEINQSAASTKQRVESIAVNMQKIEKEAKRQTK